MRKNNIWTDEEIEKIKRLCREGYEDEEIGTRMGKTSAAIQTKRIRLELPANHKKKNSVKSNYEFDPGDVKYPSPADLARMEFMFGSKVFEDVDQEEPDWWHKMSLPPRPDLYTYFGVQDYPHVVSEEV